DRYLLNMRYLASGEDVPRDPTRAILWIPDEARRSTTSGACGCLRAQAKTDMPFAGVEFSCRGCPSTHNGCRNVPRVDIVDSDPDVLGRLRAAHASPQEDLNFANDGMFIDRPRVGRELRNLCLDSARNQDKT